MAEDRDREVEPLYFDGCVCLWWLKEFMKLCLMYLSPARYFLDCISGSRINKDWLNHLKLFVLSL